MNKNIKTIGLNCIAGLLVALVLWIFDILPLRLIIALMLTFLCTVSVFFLVKSELSGTQTWIFSIVFLGVVTAGLAGFQLRVWYESKIESKILVQHLRTPIEINAAVKSLTDDATTRLRLFINVLSDTPKFPDDLARSMAEHMAEMKRQGHSIKYDAVLALNREAPPEDFSNWVKGRFNIFKNQGVGGLTEPSLFHLEKPIGVDVFIVDRKHVLIALTRFQPTRTTELGLVFENQEEIASVFAEWFDLMILDHATSCKTDRNEFKFPEKW